MKRLFILLLPVLLMACDPNGGVTPPADKEQAEVRDLGAELFSFYKHPANDMEERLTQSGWKVNYSEETQRGRYKAVYIYNRPHGSWKPFCFYSYSQSGQSHDYEALDSLLVNGKIYGEVLLECYEGEVHDISICWMVSSSYTDRYDLYKAFSKNIHGALITACGDKTSWSGTITASRNSTYSNYNEFYSDLSTLTQAQLKEEARSTDSNKYCRYEIYGNYNYYRTGSFSIYMDGCKEF